MVALRKNPDRPEWWKVRDFPDAVDTKKGFRAGVLKFCRFESYLWYKITKGH